MKRMLPAYPLFVKDPNFSIWSATELLNGSNTQNWYGAEKKIYGFLKTGKKTYCFLGNAEDFAYLGVEKAKQVALSVTAFSTDYTFRAGRAKLKIRFVSPLPPDDLELLSMPVAYMEYSVEGVEEAQVSVFVDGKIAYNAVSEWNTGKRSADVSLRGGVMALSGYESAFLGLKRQLPLSIDGDAIGADWGYWYLTGERAAYLDQASLAAYLVSGKTAFSCKGEEKMLGSINQSLSGAVSLAFDDVVSINYFGEFLKGYYLENHTVIEALDYVHAHRQDIEFKLNTFDADLLLRSGKYGSSYKNILYASLRQSVGAHKLVRDRNGEVLFLSKECCSNGCIGTVDVSYPSIPLYLLYNPELVKGMMRPILKFAKMPVWTFDFAPHDVGTYPSCSGQVYGLKRENNRFHGDYIKDGAMQTHYSLYLLPASFDAYDFNMQMPVEECANMLIMFLAAYHYDGDLAFFERDYELAEKWVEYLVKYGLKPENQLCTDDFAGHLKNNLNLAIKATVGIAAYAKLAGACQKSDVEAKYRGIAESFAAEITAFAAKFSHMPLTWDSDEKTFSLKYNFAFDKILGLGLFEQSLFESEVDYYVQKCAKFGTPLDSRKGYTKSDWLMWAASLTDDEEKRQKLVDALDKFLRLSPDRIPFGDWYETVGGKHWHFRNRTVQGGCFILLLREEK